MPFPFHFQEYDSHAKAYENSIRSNLLMYVEIDSIYLKTFLFSFSKVYRCLYNRMRDVWKYSIKKKGNQIRIVRIFKVTN